MYLNSHVPHSKGAMHGHLPWRVCDTSHTFAQNANLIKPRLNTILYTETLPCHLNAINNLPNIVSYHQLLRSRHRFPLKHHSITDPEYLVSDSACPVYKSTPVQHSSAS